MTPTQRTLQKLKEMGYHAGVVEKWNAFARIRQDLFGAIDIIACKNDVNGVWGIQTTTTGNMAARIEKATAIPAIRAFVQAGNRFSVWGWAKRGARGERKVWQLKEEPVTFNDL